MLQKSSMYKKEGKWSNDHGPYEYDYAMVISFDADPDSD